MPPRERIAVVGAGLMGHGIALVFADQGHPVAIFDPDDGVRDGVRARIADSLRSLGRDPAPADAIVVAESLEAAVADADVVFEAGPERLGVKQDIFERLGHAAPEGAILATNTSVMSIEAIGVRAHRPERVVGTHWWNPPYLVPLVEVVEAPATDPDVVARTIELLTRMGKSPVHVRRDVPGFVGNRLQHALWRQAFALLDAGVCDAETIDVVVRQGFGLRLPALGPMENADLIGLDLTLDIHEYVLPTLDPPSEPSDTLRRLVAEGKLGAKSGEGCLAWPEEREPAVRARISRVLKEATEPR